MPPEHAIKGGPGGQFPSRLRLPKIVIRSVSIAAPAGSQNSEHTPVEPFVGHGAERAQTELIPGSRRLLDSPGKERREKATAKVKRILSVP